MFSFMSHDPAYLIGQAVGIIALIFAIISFQQRTQKKIVFFQFISSTLFSVHFYLLGAYVGCLLNIIGIFRAAIFMNKDKKWAKNKFWLWFFISLSVLAGVITMDGDLNLLTWDIDFRAIHTYFAFLPMIGMILTSVAFWVENAKTVRRISFPSSPCWMIYNAYNRSFAGVATEMFVMCSIIIGMLRYDRSNNPR